MTCWPFFHKWGKWVETERGTRNAFGRVVGNYIIMEKTCERCGIIKAGQIDTP